MEAKFEIKTDANGYFRWSLLAANGDIMLVSETYHSRSAAENGIESVRHNSPFSDQYERKAAAAGFVHFLLKAGNGQVIGKSQTYSSALALENGIECVMAIARDATIHVKEALPDRRPAKP